MRSYDIVVDVTLLDRSEVQPLCLRDGAAGARTVTAMKNQTSVTAARLRTYWWPFLVFALLALPMFGMRELCRVHRPYTPSASRLLTVFIIFELLAMFGLLTEHLTLRKLFARTGWTSPPSSITGSATCRASSESRPRPTTDLWRISFAVYILTIASASRGRLRMRELTTSLTRPNSK